MNGLKLLLNKASNEEREGLQKILGAENATPATIVRNLTWNYVSLVWSCLGSEPAYKDIVRYVADNLEARYEPHDGVEEIEIAIAEKVMKTVWERMTPKQRREMEKEWQKIAGEFDKSESPAGSTSFFAALRAAELSGFGVHLLATTALGSLTGVTGIALPFAVYTTMTNAIAVIIGPVGWIGAGLFSLWMLCGANYKKLIPAILCICALRSQHEFAAAKSTGSESSKCSVCGKEPGTNVVAGKRYCRECSPEPNSEAHGEDYEPTPMSLNCEEHELAPSDIKDRWEIQNPLLAVMNSESVKHKVWSRQTDQRAEKAVFYLHGLGGALDDCPVDLEDNICPHALLIRVACYGLSEGLGNLPKNVSATFGDICAMLYNGRQSIYSIADKLGLESYSIVAHSWGGFIACIAALNDTICKKAMLLCSTPDICDALWNMHEISPAPFPFNFLVDIFAAWKIRVDAFQAKFGQAWHQAAWDAISPYGDVKNPEIDLLIFNREEDRVMKRWNVEHFIEHARDRGINHVGAEFNAYPDLPDWHDMPPTKFIKRMRQFLFGEE